MYKRLSSFDEVVKAYNDIKPIKGARANEDLRPLRERRYWWNRIMKINDNKYALLDGNFAWGSPTVEFRELTAPILWERKDDGDYITIRNHYNDGISVSRYTFLQTHLPSNLYFHYDNGKHYVSQGVNGKEEYLPKSKMNINWQTHAYSMVKDCKIVYKHEGGDNFTRANELQPFKTRRIDKDMDKEYYPKIQELYEWMQIVLPILGNRIAADKSDYATKLTESTGGWSYWYWQKNIRPEMVKDILNNPEHENRMALAVVLANEAQATHSDGRFAVKTDTFRIMHKIIRKVGQFYLIEAR